MAKGIIRTILDNHRDVAEFKKGIYVILLALDGYPVNVYGSFSNDPLNRAIVQASLQARKIKELEKKLEEFRKKKNNA